MQSALTRAPINCAESESVVKFLRLQKSTFTEGNSDLLFTKNRNTAFTEINIHRLKNHFRPVVFGTGMTSALTT